MFSQYFFNFVAQRRKSLGAKMEILVERFWKLRLPSVQFGNVPALAQALDEHISGTTRNANSFRQLLGRPDGRVKTKGFQLKTSLFGNDSLMRGKGNE